MRMRWVSCAFLVMAGMGYGFAAETPTTRPLVIAPPPGAVEGPRIDLLLGAEEVGEWKSVPLFVSETGMDAVTLASVRWEVRNAKTEKVVAHVDLQISTMVSGVVDGKPHGLNTVVFGPGVAALDALPDGEYVAAFVLNGKRVSNVVKVKRKAAHVIGDEPLARVVVSEPVQDGEPPLVGVEVARRTAADPILGPMEIQEAELTVDGKAYPSRGGFYSGPGAPRVGGRMMLSEDIQFRRVVWDVNKAHVLKAKVAGHETAEVKVPVGMPLGMAWDDATKD